jgi:hypothetical protein
MKRQEDGPHIESLTRRRNGEDDGQDLLLGRTIGLLYGSETWVLSEMERHAGRLPVDARDK